MLVAFTRMTHHYRLYGAEEDLELARMNLGLDRTKRSAIQHGMVEISLEMKCSPANVCGIKLS